MARKNYVGSEIRTWRNFTFDEITYDLSHLDAHWVELIDDRKPDQSISYRLHVTYSFHCFAKDDGSLEADEIERHLYHAPKESRPFHFERYVLSKQLPVIIESLNEQKTRVFHRGHEQYATSKVVDANGDEVDYLVVFSVFREHKQLRLHVSSAYPVEEGIGQTKKVSIYVLAHNALHNKAMPKAPQT